MLFKSYLSILSKQWNFRHYIDILPLVENSQKLNIVIRWASFTLHVFIFNLYIVLLLTESGLVMQFAWIFLKIFKYNSHEGSLGKTMKKTLKKNFMLKF